MGGCSASMWPGIRHSSYAIVKVPFKPDASTGELVEGLRHFVAGQDVVGRTYKFGMNTYDTLKRSYTQILNKGVVVESWGQRIYWVFQEYVYRNLSQRYNLDLAYDQSKAIVFALYDLKSQTGKLTLVLQPQIRRNDRYTALLLPPDCQIRRPGCGFGNPQRANVVRSLQVRL